MKLGCIGRGQRMMAGSRGEKVGVRHECSAVSGEDFQLYCVAEVGAEETRGGPTAVFPLLWVINNSLNPQILERMYQDQLHHS